MDEMKLFNNSQFGTLEVVLINGKEYFPAIDCATMLGYSNPRDAVSKHCKVDGVAFCDGVSETTNQYGVTTRQAVKKKYITEGNLWRLITHSKLPSAERFERWIFDEVIPTIRTTGGYSLGTQAYTNNDIAQIVQQATTAAMKSVVEILPVIVSETVKQIVPLLSEKAKPEESIKMIDVSCPMPKCKIDTFPSEIVLEINKLFEQMIQQQAINFSYIARYCTVNGYPVSNPAVKRYFDKHFGNV